MDRFSVLMSVYFKEQATQLHQALKSVINQSLPPSEIVIVKDGPLTSELDDVINNYVSEYKDLIKVVTLKENLGLGSALRIGVENCTFDIIARMDTDDISRRDRFKIQMQFLKEHPEIDVVGSNIEEFNEKPGDLNRFKINHEKHDSLIKHIKLKSPFNHPSIMMRKVSLLKAGNYNGDLLLFEDYSLFLRMWRNGLKFYNIQEVLLDFRVGSGIETIKRRSGRHYIKKENDFLAYAKQIGAFNKWDVLKYKMLKFPIRSLPPVVVLFIYNRFLRK